MLLANLSYAKLSGVRLENVTHAPLPSDEYRGYSLTIDPDTGDRVREQAELERYNRTLRSSYAVRY